MHDKNINKNIEKPEDDDVRNLIVQVLRIFGDVYDITDFGGKMIMHG